MTARDFRRLITRCPATYLLLLCLMVASEAASQTPISSEPASRPWSVSLGIDLGSLTSTPSLLILGIAGTAATWSWEETDEQQDLLQRSLESQSLDAALDIGNVYGSGWVVGGGSLSVLSLALLAGNEDLRNFGTDLCRSFLYAGLTTGALKYGINRRRPSGGPLSFPSGHTASAFGSVPVIWNHLGWQAGVSSGVLAVLTGMGLMEENRHYLSDVIFGAAIGIVVGRAVISSRSQDDLLNHLVVTGQQVGLAWAF